MPLFACLLARRHRSRPIVLPAACAVMLGLAGARGTGAAPRDIAGQHAAPAPAFAQVGTYDLSAGPDRPPSPREVKRLPPHRGTISTLIPLSSLDRPAPRPEDITVQGRRTRYTAAPVAPVADADGPNCKDIRFSVLGRKIGMRACLGGMARDGVDPNTGADVSRFGEAYMDSSIVGRGLAPHGH
ncbi:hypothetical protein HLH34_10835 [Gluconacetobacter azotocaptans]|uniref:Uncharacterized protein n=1 Tax=Gluconacetobacter azotocaptans TaxID=142834 RepID=A0A7W4JT59_9PROT|nr:hypothetical protein [Gluconacetobacter azotocaptans]MBB2190451.1 hypothetical protein [Gluconacetobacter azotocaptans]GBQ26514.1 hypothetical protein AA13594_0273 [Gluconacetobacter azotocaptans DSM 13594]